jgi:multidrug resistance efflux pump
MSLVAVPESLPVAGKRRIPYILATLIALGVMSVAWGGYALLRRSVVAIPPGQFYTVVPMDMDITISKDGELQAVNNADIKCDVEGQSTIIDLVKEGTYVHKGDMICKLDSSDIEQKIEQAQLDLQKAESDFVAAQEARDIQDSTNKANLEAANTDLTLARLTLEEYADGTYPSDLKSAQTDVEMAKITVKNKEDDLAQTRSLFSKGFVTSAEVKTSELDLLTAQNDLAKKSNALDVLQKYTHEKDTTEMRNDVAQAEKKLARTQRENASNMKQKVASLQQCDQTRRLRQRQLDHLQEQLAACTMTAPSEGMVVYASSVSGSWRRDTPIQPGAQIRQQELVARLPDTSAMKVVCKINEQQVPRLRVDPANPMRALVKIVGQPNLIGGWVSKISIMADSSSRWFSPDTKDYPVDVTLDYTPPGLKPGMSADSVKIFIGHLKQALAVPLGAIYAAGSDHYVFVRNGSELPRPVKVQVGEVNETHAAVTSGISAGAQVLLLGAGQGRDLLEKAGIKIPDRIDTSTTQPSEKRPPSHEGALSEKQTHSGAEKRNATQHAAAKPNADTKLVADASATAEKPRRSGQRSRPKD